jgi:hypothetical protein
LSQKKIPTNEITLPQGWTHVKKATSDWNIYRTRFLIKAKQLSGPLMFVDALGREHRGQQGDYLTEWSGGIRRIVPREFFEDVYVPMEPMKPQPASAVSVEQRRQPQRVSLAPPKYVERGRANAYVRVREF